MSSYAGRLVKKQMLSWVLQLTKAVSWPQDLTKSVHFKPGVPIKAMLAKPTNGISEVLDKFQDCEFTVEYKYDGERAQVHVDEQGQVYIYSRNRQAAFA